MPASVVEELRRLADRGVVVARPAWVWARRFPTFPAQSRGDDAVLEVARRHRAWVVTGDQELARRLQDAGVSVLVPRDRHRLELHRAHRRGSPKTRPVR